MMVNAHIAPTPPNPFPQAELDSKQPSRLRARTTLPGDPHANWREGYWVGLVAGVIIGAAAVAMLWWSRLGAV